MRQTVSPMLTIKPLYPLPPRRFEHPLPDDYNKAAGQFIVRGREAFDKCTGQLDDIAELYGKPAVTTQHR